MVRTYEKGENIMKLLKDAFSFKDDQGKQVDGFTYYLVIPTQYGDAKVKLLTKTDLEKKVLDSLIEKQR